MNRIDVVAPPQALLNQERKECADTRSLAVWREWLAAMASDAEAALAAAIAYRELSAAGRESWIESLQTDAPVVDVPSFALYAPLLAVETEPVRRARLLAALGPEWETARPQASPRALWGQSGKLSVYVLILPLYLDFVQVLACGIEHKHFQWVRHDPIALASSAPQAQKEIEGVRLEDMPVKATVDVLAETILSHRRQGLALPEALAVLTDLLGNVGP